MTVEQKPQAGATLLEILMAMLVIALVAGGMLTAFVFSRRVSWRSGSELSGVQFVREIADEFREVAAGTAPVGLTLAPGVYVDANMLATARPPGAQVLPAPNPLNLPADFRARFQTNAGRAPAATWAEHADGRLYVVEDAPVAVDADDPPDGIQQDEIDAALDAADLDGDGAAGLDFNNDGTTDLRRVRVKLRWTTPES